MYVDTQAMRGGPAGLQSGLGRGPAGMYQQLMRHESARIQAEYLARIGPQLPGSPQPTARRGLWTVKDPQPSRPQPRQQPPARQQQRGARKGGPIADELGRKLAGKAHASSAWLTAVHEAGHAVAASVLGVEFSVCSIVSDSDSLGRVSLSDVGRSKPESVVAVCYAGAAALWREAGKPMSTVSLRDALFATDRRIVAEQSKRTSKPDSAVAVGREVAIELVGKHWKAIDSVARNLIGSGWKWLDERAVAEIVRASTRG